MHHAKKKKAEKPRYIENKEIHSPWTNDDNIVTKRFEFKESLRNIYNHIRGRSELNFKIFGTMILRMSLLSFDSTF